MGCEDLKQMVFDLVINITVAIQMFKSFQRVIKPMHHGIDLIMFQLVQADKPQQ
jgi:hypothetical protein